MDIHIYMYIYIYIKRERVKKRERILTFEASEVVGESYTFLLSAISLTFNCMDILSMLNLSIKLYVLNCIMQALRSTRASY